MQGDMDCPRTFNKFLNVDQPIPISDQIQVPMILTASTMQVKRR